MSPPYLPSDAEAQYPTQRTRQQSSALFTSDASTSIQGFSNMRFPPLPRPISHDHFHPISSSDGAFVSPSAPNPRDSSYFHANRHEDRHFTSPYENLSLSVPSFPDRLPMRGSHGSRMDYPTPLVSHPLVPGGSRSYQQRSNISPTYEEPYAPAWHRHTTGIHSGSSSRPRELGSIASPPDSFPVSPSELSCPRTSRSIDSRYSETSQSTSDLQQERRQLEVDVLRLRAHRRVWGLALRLTAGMLPNREYYPLPHHQSQFDALALHDASILQDRENVGLNTLDCEFGEPPPHSMPIIIECAILGSPYQKLTLSELRVTLKRRFRHYEIEEEKGVKSWERTLLQNLSKKSRFINTERSMSEPGQGGYWQVDHNAPPPSRARRRNMKRFSSPQPTSSSASPIDHVDPPVSSTLGSSSSLFPSVLAEQLPGGRAHGMNEHCIVLPTIQKSNTAVFPSSPKRWKISTGRVDSSGNKNLRS